PIPEHYENLDTGHILFAPTLSKLPPATPASPGRSMILRQTAQIQTLTFSFGCAGPLPDRRGIAIGFLPRPPRQSWYATRIGAAIAIEEYVPIRIPMTRAKLKPCSTSPPKRNSASTVRKVKPAVKIVLLKVWLMLLLTMSARFSRRSSLMFSRMRSNTTMVSLLEYPIRVRMAAITVRE